MTMIEKILASHAGVAKVRPGDIVETELDTVILMDVNFVSMSWPDIRRVDHPDRVIVTLDHNAPAKDIMFAEAHRTARKFVKEFQIGRFHDVGPDGGIVHQVVGERAYALPGSILVCADSHTCSGGAYNAAARGVGMLDVVHAACTGRTWWECGPTVRYEINGTCQAFVSPKDVFLFIADRFGLHTIQNIEFYGTTVDRWEIDERRTLATMCAELGAEFPIFPCDDRLRQFLADRGRHDFEPVESDPDASYVDRRVIEASRLEPMVGLPDAVANNCRTVAALVEENIRVDQCFIGSCANGTLQDIEVAARVVRGRRVADAVRFIVTPASQKIYREAVKAGYVEILSEAGAIVTASACGACSGLDMGALASGETAITSSTRNYKGRMGSPEAQIYMASSATVAASALLGRIADPREVAS